MNARKVKYSRGFTLIEIMVAIVLLAVVMTIVSAAFISVSNSAELARNSADELRLKQFIMDNITANLEAVCAQADYGFVGVDGEGAYGPADSLEFACLAPATGANALPGVVKFVSYQVTEPGDLPEDVFDEDREEVALQITEEYLIQTETFFGEEVEAKASGEERPKPRTLPIRSMNITYYDAQEEEWVDEWDSSSIGYLPWAVDIKINLARTRQQLDAEYYAGIDPAEEPDIELVIPLPAGAGVVSEFVDLNHFTGSILEAGVQNGGADLNPGGFGQGNGPGGGR